MNIDNHECCFTQTLVVQFYTITETKMARNVVNQYHPLTISDLAALQNDPIVGHCVHWEDVGLQVGHGKHDTDAIKKTSIIK